MINLSLRVKASQANRDGMLKVLRALLGPMRVSPGCLSCQLHQDVENSNMLTLIEEWETEESLRAHVRSVDFGRVLAVLDMSSKPPEIKVNTISNTACMEGMEAIEAMRS